MKKNKQDKKILDKIKKIYQNFGIDILIMEEEEFQRILEHYSQNPDKLQEDLKKSGIHANSFSDVDII